MQNSFTTKLVSELLYSYFNFHASLWVSLFTFMLACGLAYLV